ATVDGRIGRVQIKIPEDFVMPPDGLNIRLGDQALLKEARLHDYKRAAILAFARANKLDRTITSGGQNPKIGIITCGKSYLDVRAAFDELGIDEVKANQLGLRLYKAAMTWPLEPQGVLKFAEGLDLILVIEEKRSLIETQVKEQLYDLPKRPRVLGKKDENEQWLFPAKYALDPSDIAIKVGERLIRNGAGDDIKARVAELKRIKGSQAIRAARAAGVNMTFKILYNDAVAMTGGQALDGGMTVPMIVNQVLAEGIEKVVVVTDEPHKYAFGAIPQGVPVHHRRELQSLQKELREVPGVSVLVYDQTCASEKRRRRKRG